MASMILGRQPTFALICAIFFVSASTPAALAQTNTTVVTETLVPGDLASTVTTPLPADTASVSTADTASVSTAATAPVSTAATTPVSTAAMISTTAIDSTTTSNVSNSSDGQAFTASATTVTSFITTAIEATTTSNVSSSADGPAFTTTDKSLIAVMTPLPNATESLTDMSTLATSASVVISYTNASSVAPIIASITSSEGTSSANFSVPATGTYSSSIGGSETLASSSLPPTTSPGAASAYSSPADYSTTSAAVESTASSRAVQSTPPTAVGTSTASASDSGMTLPVTQIIIITVSSVAGGILVIIVIIGVAVHCRRRQQRQPKISHPTDFPLPPVNVPTRSRTVNLADFKEYVNQLSADSDYGFAEEYEELGGAGADQPITAAKEESNRSKNRYSNVLPCDHSRVKLHASLISDKSDYINANYIPGHNGPKEFIATQGPLEVTAVDFWRMVWEQQCKAIVMLTRCVEGLVDKCYHYWPSGHDPVVYGDVTVQVTDELEQPQWTVTNFSVSLGAKAHSDNADTPHAAVRHVRHFHFTAFPDHRAPLEIDSMLQFVRMVRSKLQPAAAGGGSGPVIVHCSAGVGRTGTFIAIDRLLQQIDGGRTSIDIFGIVREMRMHRMLMVQTEEQYIFIHKIILHELQKQRNSVALNGGTDNKAFEDDPVA